MKITTLILGLFLVSTQNSTPPIKAVYAFKQKFPSATNIKWNQITFDTDSLYYDKNKKQNWINVWEVDFKLNHKKANAGFTSNGDWFQTVLEKSISDTRDEVKKGIEREYPNCKILSIFFVEYAGQGSWYAVQVKCGGEIKERTFDENGELPPKQ